MQLTTELNKLISSCFGRAVFLCRRRLAVPWHAELLSQRNKLMGRHFRYGK